jgi:hypothetical protein
VLFIGGTGFISSAVSRAVDVGDQGVAPRQIVQSSPPVQDVEIEPLCDRRPADR